MEIQFSAGSPQSSRRPWYPFYSSPVEASAPERAVLFSCIRHSHGTASAPLGSVQRALAPSWRRTPAFASIAQPAQRSQFQRGRTTKTNTESQGEGARGGECGKGKGERVGEGERGTERSLAGVEQCPQGYSNPDLSPSGAGEVAGRPVRAAPRGVRLRCGTGVWVRHGTPSCRMVPPEPDFPASISIFDMDDTFHNCWCTPRPAAPLLPSVCLVPDDHVTLPPR